ncbi:MAG: hypothetical protein NUV93_07325 [Firmicutes bacterium]|nr:hypothetical protein [Bacillota bacterium]
MTDPYASGTISGDPFHKKIPVNGKVVAVLSARAGDRGIRLIEPRSRVLVKGDVHEMLLTDEDAGPGQTVNRVAYSGFFEVCNSGVVVTGDAVLVRGVELGRVAGFDLSHFPNHMNIVVRSGSPMTGEEMGLEPGMEVQFGVTG